MLSTGNEPDFRAIADSRKTPLRALTGFFERVLRVACEPGAPGVGFGGLAGAADVRSAAGPAATAVAPSSTTTMAR